MVEENDKKTQSSLIKVKSWNDGHKWGEPNQA